MKREEYIYKLRILATGEEAVFACLSAIFVDYTRAELGVSLRDLWGQNISTSTPYTNELCEITRHRLWRKKQANPHRTTTHPLPQQP